MISNNNEFVMFFQSGACQRKSCRKMRATLTMTPQTRQPTKVETARARRPARLCRSPSRRSSESNWAAALLCLANSATAVSYTILYNYTMC